MTIQRMIELLEIEHECILRNSHGDCDRNCGDCDLVQDDEELHVMYTDVISILKQQEPAKVRHLHNAKVTVHEEIVFTDACENCSSYLLKHWKACPICGKPVKWDENP